MYTQYNIHIYTININNTCFTVEIYKREGYNGAWIENYRPFNFGRRRQGEKLTKSVGLSKLITPK